MRVLRLELAYDGASFHGWQIQSQPDTVQGELQRALGRLTKRPELKVNGASRTDAGVHALGQVASIPWPDDARAIGPHELMRALDSLLPDPISVLRLEEVHALDHRGRPFHARHCARGKRYRYRIWASRLRNPFLASVAWQPRGLPDLDGWQRARDAAALLLGEHDFAGFRAADCAANDTVRTLHRLDLLPPADGDHTWEILVEGSSFLKNMVRVIAGTLFDVAYGRLSIDHVADALRTGDRARAGQTAPAHGLCLEEVFYPDFPWTLPRWSLPPRP
jgi:tRNA pseudouridine38-40 synthase